MIQAGLIQCANLNEILTRVLDRKREEPQAAAAQAHASFRSVESGKEDKEEDKGAN